MLLKSQLLDLMVCPECGATLELRNEQWVDEEIESGNLVCLGGGHSYRVERFIPRFVEADEYVDAFTLEWNEFRTVHHVGSGGRE